MPRGVDPRFTMQRVDCNKWQQIGPLRDFVQTKSVVGAVRFTVCPSFKPATVFNFVYSSEVVTLFKLAGWNCLGAEVPLSKITRFATIATWPSLRAAALAAPSCMTLMGDGVSYGHSLWDRETALDAEWSNPSPRDHPVQCRLVHEYLALIALAWPSLEGRRVALRTGLFAGCEGVIQCVDERANCAKVRIQLLGKEVVVPTALDHLDFEGA